ncbi:MAG TPA: hypothetical protein VLM40_20450, partial [Gemmata sp.]|nr:hypothetical protein [Gemmata sp.]
GGTMPDPRGGSAQPGRGFLGGGGSGGSGGGGALPGGGFPSGGFPGGAIPDIPTPPKKVDRFDLRPVTGPLPSFPETKFSDPSGTELITDFPGKADTLALGGAGRYLAMHFADAGKLVVVDLCEAKIVADKEADKGKVKLAAGLSRLVVWAPAARLFRVYDLPNLEKLYDAKCELFHGPQFIAMGNRTNGPLLASDFTGEVVLHDISKNDAPVIEGSRGRPGIHSGSEFGVRATPDGKVFATFDGFDKNHKAVLLSESGGKWSATKDTFAAYFPNAAGDLFFGNGGAMDASGRSANISSVGFGSDQWFVPATSGKFFLKIVSVPPSGGGKKTLTLTVHMNNRANIRYPGLQPIQGIEAEGFLDGWSPAALDQHFILIPESKVLVFIPPSNDRVHFKRIEIR